MINLYNSQITDILPTSLAYDPKVQALSYAIMKSNQRMINTMQHSLVYVGIDTLPEDILDVLATELRAKYYEASLPINQKREIIKNTLYLFTTSGTPSAVEDLINQIFGSGELIEWFENDGVPGTFEINTTAGISADSLQKFDELISRVKNIRSHLVAINAGVKLTSDINISIGMVYATTIKVK